VRILIVSNRFPPVTVGGYELCCAEVAERLAGSHDVLVLTSRAEHPPAREPLTVRRELPLLSSGPRGSLRAPLAAIAATRLVRRVVADFRPELVFVWNGAAIPHAALRVLELADATMAYSVSEHWFGRIYRDDQFLRHLYPGDRGLRRIWALVMRAVNRVPGLRIELRRRVPAAIAWNSNALRGMTPVPDTTEPTVQRTIYPATRRNAVYAELSRRPAAEPTVLFVGRLEHLKGPDIAYRALADLRGRHGIPARLVMAGRSTPAERRGLADLAAELGISSHVRLAGQLDPDALVVPSRWDEPFGLVCIEAALARLPVVAARSGGIPEALHEGEHALFFDKEHHADCADALAATLTGASATEARVRRAFEHARGFTADRHLREMESFVEAAAATGPRKR
jgi:glycosyltransferase involved in cell wall biosynthesis